MIQFEFYKTYRLFPAVIIGISVPCQIQTSLVCAVVSLCFHGHELFVIVIMLLDCRVTILGPIAATFANQQNDDDYNGLSDTSEKKCADHS